MCLGTCQQVDGIERFADEVSGAGRGGALHGRLGVIRTGYDDDRNVVYVRQMRTADLFQQAESVQVGHGQVGNDQGKRFLAGQDIPCIVTIYSFDGFEVFLQNLAGGDPDDLGVVNDQETLFIALYLAHFLRPWRIYRYIWWYRRSGVCL